MRQTYGGKTESECWCDDCIRDKVFCQCLQLQVPWGSHESCCGMSFQQGFRWNFTFAALKKRKKEKPRLMNSKNSRLRRGWMSCRSDTDVLSDSWKSSEKQGRKGWEVQFSQFDKKNSPLQSKSWNPNQPESCTAANSSATVKALGICKSWKWSVTAVRLLFCRHFIRRRL